MAAMASSRTPQRTLRPPGVAACWSGASLIRVLFDGARSAEPPISVGMCGATALMTLPEAARVATLSSVVNTGRSASQPSGRVRDQASSHDLARAASAARHASYFGVHSACASAAFLPAARKASRTSSGTKNSGSSGHSQASLVSLTSSAPSGAP